MKELNLKYLEENFETLEQVAEKSDVPINKIRSYIEENLIPQPSYKVSKTIEVTSPLDDKHRTEVNIWYFPKSYVELVKTCENQNAQKVKESFISKMKQHLLQNQTKELAYENAVSDEARLEQELENEWNYYQKGIYGICTLNASPEEIIEKEIAVKKLLQFFDTFSEDEWKDNEIELIKIIAEFDKVSSRFAPFQRKSSSRGKYVDKTLQKLGLIDKIKKY